MWCSAYRMDNLKSDIKSGLYTPAQFREKGGLEFSPDFQKAYSCPSTPKENVCNLW